MNKLLYENDKVRVRLIRLNIAVKVKRPNPDLNADTNAPCYYFSNSDQAISWLKEHNFVEKGFSLPYVEPT